MPTVNRAASPAAISRPSSSSSSNWAAPATLEQDERRTVLSAGDWAVYDVSRGYRMQNVSDLDQLVLLLPHGDTSRALARMVRAAPNRAFRSDGLSRVLRTASQTALDEAEGVGSTGSIGLGQTLAELASLAVTQQMDAAPRITAAETVRDRIARTVLRNLRDPDLSIDTIATRLRYSKRYLHKAFSGDGQTLAQFIWSARLERCERDLIDPRLSERSITEIAFGWGFVNSAHFSRSFRARYGMAPREHREQAARAA
ncbi:MAG: helix-turn-helix domain-containing protein [Sphingomonas fennica]